MPFSNPGHPSEEWLSGKSPIFQNDEYGPITLLYILQRLVFRFVVLGLRVLVLSEQMLVTPPSASRADRSLAPC